MRLVCLSAESADICVRLGVWEEVVAVTVFASQAGLAPRPVIGGFSTADCDRIAALRPDLVLCFSDVQADLAAQLIRRGCAVLVTNPRTLAEIAASIRLVGGTIGRAPAGAQLADHFLNTLAQLKNTDTPTPRVYFEEWPEPLISGIGWVGELIELCGGVDLFAARRGHASRERTVEPREVIAANPDIILASWCGKRVDLEAIRTRPGFANLRAIQTNALHALDSDHLLQPGPALLPGAEEIHRILTAWRMRQAAR